MFRYTDISELLFLHDHKSQHNPRRSDYNHKNKCSRLRNKHIKKNLSENTNEHTNYHPHNNNHQNNDYQQNYTENDSENDNENDSEHYSENENDSGNDSGNDNEHYSGNDNEHDSETNDDIKNYGDNNEYLNSLLDEVDNISEFDTDSDADEDESIHENKSVVNSDVYCFNLDSLKNKTAKLISQMNSDKILIKTIKKYLAYERQVLTGELTEADIRRDNTIPSLFRFPLYHLYLEDEYEPIYTTDDLIKTSKRIRENNETIERYKNTIDFLRVNDNKNTDIYGRELDKLDQI